MALLVFERASVMLDSDNKHNRCLHIAFFLKKKKEKKKEKIDLLGLSGIQNNKIENGLANNWLWNRTSEYWFGRVRSWDLNRLALTYWSHKLTWNMKKRNTNGGLDGLGALHPLLTFW